MPLETGSGVRLAGFQETVHHAAFPGVYKGEYRRGLLVSQASIPCIRPDSLTIIRE